MTNEVACGRVGGAEVSVGYTNFQMSRLHLQAQCLWQRDVASDVLGSTPIPRYAAKSQKSIQI